MTHPASTAPLVSSDLRTLNVGISGFGRLAQNYYVPALRRLKNINVCAIADPSELCRAAGGTLIPGVRTYPAQESMLQSESLHALLIASPPSAHLESWNHASGQPDLFIFMEKPFVLPGQRDRVNDSPDAIARLMVNFNRRFWSRYQNLSRVAQSGEIGKLVSVELELQVDLVKWVTVSDHRLRAGEGGVLYDLGSQMLDLACVIIGKRPTSIHTAKQPTHHDANHLDVSLTFPDDITARCLISYDKPTRERIAVRCTGGEARIHNPNMAMHITRKPEAPLGPLTKLVDLATIARHAAARHTSMSRYTIELALADFFDRIRTGRPFSPGFDDADFNAILLESALQSLSSNQPGNVPAPRRGLEMTR